ncbi:hypothetical protein BD414DRAFT_506437 [Trametes punicea]|nr:hypothetical protein BD414DRAFT_506437 [Trametes punicea]
MKRAADKQLSKDDIDEDDGVEEVGTGFKMADESVLAKRPIKGLPRRSLAAAANASATPSSVPTTSEAPTALPKFAGFTGFGSSATSSTPFSFTAQSATSNLSKPAPAAVAASPFTSASTTSQSTSTFAPVSSNASAATKAFASIVSSSSAPAASTPTPSGDATPKADEKEVEYYKALRGLNVSLLSAISKAIEADPFVDVAHLLERYKSLRISVDAGRENKAKAVSEPLETANGSSEPSLKPAEAAIKPPSAPAFSMPAPPSSFAGFKPPAPSSVSTSSSGSGFMPKVDSTSANTLGSPFSFATSKPSTSESTSTSEAPKPAFTFGSSSSSSAPGANASSSFTFGAPPSGSSIFGKPSTSSSGSAPSLFGTPPPSSTSVFGGNFFGKPADASKEKEADKSDEKDLTPAPAPSTSSPTPSGSLFGSSSATGPNPFATSTPEKSSSSSPAPFTFGSASPGKSNFFSGFPKAGSIGNPVGFGFGSPPKTPEAEGGSGPVKSLPFSFGPPETAARSEPHGGNGAEEKAAEGGEKEGGESGESTPAPAEGGDAPQVLPSSTSVHDLEGEGEEDEITTHEIRSKVYKMIKDKDGKVQWGDMGVGVLRLKKHKETETRRMLLRNSSTGKITINFILYSGMNATVSDKVVSFMGHEDGQSTPYRIRTKTAAQANELKAALDREIEFVRAKSETS